MRVWVAFESMPALFSGARDLGGNHMRLSTRLIQIAAVAALGFAACSDDQTPGGGTDAGSIDAGASVDAGSGAVDMGASSGCMVEGCTPYEICCDDCSGSTHCISTPSD